MDTGTQGSMTMAGSTGLAQAHAYAVLVVKDYRRAKKFYTDTLGLQVRDATGDMMQGMGTVVTGDGTAFEIYENPSLSTPQNTTLALVVKDFDKTFQELKGRGVTFEDYDIPGMDIHTAGGISEMRGIKSAWFKDSEGNIINLISEYPGMTM